MNCICTSMMSGAVDSKESPAAQSEGVCSSGDCPAGSSTYIQKDVIGRMIAYVVLCWCCGSRDAWTSIGAVYVVDQDYNRINIHRPCFG